MAGPPSSSVGLRVLKGLLTLAVLVVALFLGLVLWAEVDMYGGEWGGTEVARLLLGGLLTALVLRLIWKGGRSSFLWLSLLTVPTGLLLLKMFGFF